MTEIVVRLVADEKHFNGTNLQLLYHPFVRPYYYLCNEEIELMKRANVESDLKCFDIFVANKYKLAHYAANQKVIEAFKRGKLLELFPIYANYLAPRIERGAELRNLIKNSIGLMKKELPPNYQ